MTPPTDRPVPEHLQRPPREQRFDAVLADYLSQIDRGETPDRDAFRAAHPDLSEDLAAYFEVQDRMQRLAGSQHGGPAAPAGERPLPGGAGAALLGTALARAVDPDPTPRPPLRDYVQAARRRVAQRLDLLGQRLLDSQRDRPAVGPAATDAQRPGTPAVPAGDAPLPPGSLLGQYRLGEVLGEGGMGRVYQATHLHLDRQLAVKVLAPRLARDPALVQRFHREARALARLSHPHIVGIHDMGSQGDVHYFVMESIRGRTLRQQLADGPLAPVTALRLARSLCDALAYAHDQGVIHRDLKPENVLLDETGAPRLADFGLAKVLQADGDGASAGLTASHVVLGTFDYMAPEQKRSARVDGRADLYSLGVVLYELLTGRLPAGAFEPPSRLAPVGPGLDRVLLKLLQQDPDDRHADAAELAADLDGLLAGGEQPLRLAPGATPLPDTLRIVDRSADRELGSGAAGWIRLVVTDGDDLTLRPWSQPFVGLSCDANLRKKASIKTVAAATRPWIGGPEDEAPGLEVTLPADDVEVNLPEGLPVVVVGAEGDVDVAGLRAPLRIEPGDGDVLIRDHQGPLHVDRLDDGDLRVDHLDSRSFELSTRDGDLTVTGLRLLSGEGRLHTDDGDLTVGVVTDASAFTYELRAAGGTLSCDFGEVAPQASDLTGQHGEGGRARLLASSYAGDVHVGDTERLSWKLQLKESLDGSFWTIAIVAFCFWQDWNTIALIILVCWVAELGWKHGVRRGLRIGTRAHRVHAHAREQERQEAGEG